MLPAFVNLKEPNLNLYSSVEYFVVYFCSAGEIFLINFGELEHVLVNCDGPR